MSPIQVIVHPGAERRPHAIRAEESASRSGGKANRASTPLRSQLADLGYSPKDITYLAVSHSHADHTANASDYAGSTWLVQKAERESMFNERARTQAAFANYSALESSKTVLLEG